MSTPARRRALGAFYTPTDVAERLVAIALDGIRGAPTVCDPACGDGVFLLAAGRALVARDVPASVVAGELLWGCDIDVDAVASTRSAVIDWSGVDPGDHLVVDDGLAVAERWRHRFDAVVGNPPFLNQLERATVRRSPVPAYLAPLTRPYTDTAWLFLVAGHEMARAGGRTVLVQPQSLLGARDAAPVRRALEPVLEGLWWCDEPLFDASVRVCAPVLGRSAATVRRWSGRELRDAGSIAWSSSSWGALVPSDVPPVSFGQATLAEIATATAGFRDEYYGLRPYVRDERDGDRPLLVTSGLIDVGRIAWGERPTGFGRQPYTYPRVDTAPLTGSLARWVQQRLVPKVVVATQTKVVEAAVDVDGTWIPSTPVVAVHAPPSELWRVAALLTAPAVSAWALRTHPGVALAPNAIKLSARQVLEAPLPIDDAAWSEGADMLAAGQVLAAGEAMGRAYRTSDDVLDWWRGRLPRSTRPD